MALIRTFHPIGQGAFYTERHKTNETEFTIVYDCGSTTLKAKDLERKIKSTFPKGHSIDILFISHFHADHINGIEVLENHCRIKKVVMPLLDDDAKILLKVTNILEGDFIDTRLIDDPEDFFGDRVSVIKIKPADINPNSDGIALGNRIDISKTYIPKNTESGTVFNQPGDIDWLFIPFNYKQDERKQQFETELGMYGLTLADVDTIGKINRNKPNIVKAYNAVDGDLNGNSMILFSGKNSDDHVQNFERNHHCFLHRHVSLHIQSGCLYMGDLDLNEPAIVTDIEGKLRRLIPFIGTLQIPHHGSIHNFSSLILKPQMWCTIFSYGTNNIYGHPSDRVIEDVISNNLYPHFVTEEKNSIVTQWK